MNNKSEYLFIFDWILKNKLAVGTCPTKDEDLKFIEVQVGTYFGEADIVRLEDDYGREGTSD